jgi:taurine dioxygenase
MLKTTPIQGDFGVRIEGLDVSRPLEPNVVEELIDTLHDHRLILLKGQSPDKEQYMAFGSHFGRPNEHMIRKSRMKDHPAMIELTNVTKNGEEPTRAAVYWHTDMCWEREPSSVTMLYAVEVPESGGETLIADMVQAYDDLPLETKNRIEGLKVIHYYGMGVATRKDDIGPKSLESLIEKDEDVGAEHLLARPHSVTGRIALYSPAGTSRGIVGMDQDEATALLNELSDHAIQSRYIYEHKWSVGDIVMYDTSLTMHTATPIDAATGPQDTRRLYRISVKGKPPIYA